MTGIADALNYLISQSQSSEIPKTACSMGRGVSLQIELRWLTDKIYRHLTCDTEPRQATGIHRYTTASGKEIIDVAVWNIRDDYRFCQYGVIRVRGQYVSDSDALRVLQEFARYLGVNARLGSTS